jgi:3-oxoacyl-[acyl-carrier protein] reductase
MFDLGGRVALVTGAGRGVGAGISRQLASQGASVAVNDIVAERAASVAAELVAAGGQAVAVPFDVTVTEAVVDAVARIETELGPVDILVNNAGNFGEGEMPLGSFRELPPETWQAPIAVNIFGVFNCCHAVIGGMVERRWGRVITISSGAALTGLRLGVAAYGASKGASIAFTRHLAMENARFGVTANTLALGLMAADDQSENPGDHAGTAVSGLAKSIPVGRLGTPADIGYLCGYLASSEASWMTGQTIPINGGSIMS